MSFIREADAEPIPGYRLIEPLGSGGFGEVWKCEAPGGLYKAIKFVYGNLNSPDSEGVRAEQELHALQRIREVRHPFVLSMDRIEVVGGELVIVMELADKSLHDLFLECQAAGLVGIPRDSLLRYLRDAAEALDHMLEKHNLLHLDVKPRNLFLISDRVKVADFGLVKHLERQGASGLLGGVTPLYAAPETFANKLTPQSDQYSLAIVYQELLTGQRPFNGKNARQLAMQHVHEPPELRWLPEAERPIVARALSKDPAKRFPSCLAFIRALYNASAPVARLEPTRVVEGPPELARPKTLRDTLEDIVLGASPDEEVDLGGPAPEGCEQGSFSKLGITVAQPETGALRPTVVVGVGTFGRRALVELRCRLVDRFGELSKLPMFQFLYLDSDLEAIRSAGRGAAEVALGTGEVCPLPLQPVGNYRRRILEQLSEWLPREKLYAMPRSLQTQGSRALGRLALTDNYLRLSARLRKTLQRATHPDSIYQSVSQTGLALRGTVPRVYVVAAAGGGSSGLLVDLGYILRRLLHQLRYSEGEVFAFLFCGAPDDPATPPAEQANVYATFTELNHYHDPATQFTAEYGPEGARIAESGGPYTGIYLLRVPHRSPEALRDVVAHWGSYVFHDMTTPLGLRLDRIRLGAEVAGTPFRSFGTYAVWFPRGLLLRLAARRACGRLLIDWQGAGEPTAAAEVAAACARLLADPELRLEAICHRLEQSAVIPSEGPPAEALATLLARLEEQSHQSLAHNDPDNWARQALGRIREWVGTHKTSEHDSDWRKSRLSRALTQAMHQLAAEWEKKLADEAFSLMELPGRRVAAAEAALKRLIQFCQEVVLAQKPRLDQQGQRTQQAWTHLEEAWQRCLDGVGGFSLFGSRMRRLVRVFVDHLAAFARQRLTEEVLLAGSQFFATLKAKLEERCRDLTFCRQRLRHLQESLEAPAEEAEWVAAGTLEAAHLAAADAGTGVSPVPSTESYWETIRQSNTVRVVLPDDEADLETASARFLALVTSEQWTALDQLLQDRVLAPRGGLYAACAGTTDLFRNLASPLVDRTAEYLSGLLPVTDVAQVELSAAAQGVDVLQRTREYFERAAPLVASAQTGQEQAFLLVPTSGVGKAYGDDVKRWLPNVHLVRVPGQADLMFCREQRSLSLEDVQKLLQPCRAAYERLAPAPNTSPHSRFDITDWVPLDP
ncbi:MAG: protein kinase [Gemmataceae bacterium]|nr:protein kinase [Gemmataceae bacterium]MDW8264402.1 tubulin-like doman-containing protein [Gemmataceae bacterium]